MRGESDLLACLVKMDLKVLLHCRVFMCAPSRPLKHLSTLYNEQQILGLQVVVYNSHSVTYSVYVRLVAIALSGSYCV